ncbi:MAG: LysR family transcriptional regulator [Pseudomonadota bacterium]
MELRQLRYFVAVADAGSFSGAAAALGIQQPTVSQHIRKLEDRLHTDLFERRARGIRLTRAGEHLLRVARRIVADMDQALRHATAVAKAEAGMLSIGFYTSLSSGPLRDTIAAYRAAAPRVAFELFEGSPPDLLAALRGHRIDLALTVGEVIAPDLAMLRLWDEPLLAALPGDSPLARQESVSWADLAAAPLVVRTWERGPVLYTFLAGKLTPHALMPEIVQHFISREALLSAVGIGFGITVVGRTAAGLAYPGVAFRPLAEPDASIPVIALWLPDNGNPMRQKFVADLRDRVRADARQLRSGPAS